MSSPSPSSASVSLPSIHEMFPDHLMRKDETQRPRSHRGHTYPQSPGVHHTHRHRAPESHCGCSHADCPRQPHVSLEEIHNLPSSTASASARRRSSTASASQNIYAFNVLRSSPTSSSLQHINSSATLPNRPPNPQQLGCHSVVASGSSPAFRVDVSLQNEYFESHSQDGRSAYPSPLDGYTPSQRTRGSVEGDPHPAIISFPVSHPGTGPLPPTSKHHQMYPSTRSSGSVSGMHGDAEDSGYVTRAAFRSNDGQGNDDEDDGNASGTEDNDTSNGKKHVCPTCYKRFNRPSSLRIHVNTHTGATPFRCPWPNCGREFNVNSNMRRHYRNHTTPGFSRSQNSTTNPASNGAADDSSIANIPTDGRRKRRRVSIPQVQIPPPSQSANLANRPPSSDGPYPHGTYRSEYSYRHPAAGPAGSQYYQSQPVSPHAAYPPHSQFSSSQHTQHHHQQQQQQHTQHHPHTRSHAYPHYLNAESVMPSPPISNLSMSEEDESSGSGDDSDVGMGGMKYRQKKIDEEDELMQYDEHGYRTGSLTQSLARVAVHRNHPYSRSHHREHHREHGPSYAHQLSSVRGGTGSASGKGYDRSHPPRPLTPGSSFHSSSPSPSVSPSPPPTTSNQQSHALSSERQDAHKLSAQSSYKYSASTPYVRSLADSRVSTTLRPAFAGSNERETRKW